MNLTQLERIKTELKHKRYGENKIKGSNCDYLWISGASKQDLQDTLNSARKKNRLQGYIYKSLRWDLCVKGGIFLGGFP
jgi:hypothetical protein